MSYTKNLPWTISSLSACCLWKTCCKLWNCFMLKWKPCLTDSISFGDMSSYDLECPSGLACPCRARVGISKHSGHMPKQKGVLCLEGREKEQVDKFATTNNTHTQNQEKLFCRKCDISKVSLFITRWAFPNLFNIHEDKWAKVINQQFSNEEIWFIHSLIWYNFAWVLEIGASHICHEVPKGD